MSLVRIAKVSRWYGNVVAVNDVSMSIGPGVTGLLGPNGAGKSTLITMMAGFLPPSTGSVTLDDVPIWRNERAYAQIGLVPETEAVYDTLSGADFVRANAELHGLANAGAAAATAIATVAMEEAAGRRIATYSKGMKQRIKMAAALVHEPSVLLLDEPFNGMDPRQRLHLMELLRKMGAEGRTVLFSSHILEEVQQVATHIEVVVSGRHAASGDYRAIRTLMTDRPVLYRMRTSDDRRIAAALIGDPCTTGADLDAEALHVQVADFERFSKLVPGLARELGIRLHEVSPTDESLESVFSYLVGGKR
ncbi:ABC-2 type transport system ATP-binding protein [Kribbella amoyensis]|uniref:ABC-2 type transport system ATP-binding protein n=1 Tax=Kribbella amoyensis TaxID=996641 RepID=A0A561BUY3_9ACTN|nr:ABC transporter ATP-binding protein [Kribbella amoyensis]TWD82705.1 ABC-2 type transport system ATP-binding protein [Kribbella amoyensis]